MSGKEATQRLQSELSKLLQKSNPFISLPASGEENSKCCQSSDA